MQQQRVSILIAAWNGSRYLPSCLEAVRRQTYPHIELIVWDNASTDTTATIVATRTPAATLIRNDTNIGMWPAMECMLEHVTGQYVLCLSADVILSDTFVEQAVQVFESDVSIDALQPKLYQYTLEDRQPLPRTTIDTCGFALTRGRKVLNLGHGQPDGPQWSLQGEVFGVEGAAPMFRTSALKNARVQGSLIDHDYFWYGDDLDLAWRLRLLGHRQVFAPTVVGWHDRSTTKGFAITFKDHLKRIGIRNQMPVLKRQLDYMNVRRTIIKNDYLINLLIDAPWIIPREIGTILYMLIVEPQVLPAVLRLIQSIPRMLIKRRAVMSQAKQSWRIMRYHMFTHTIHE